MKQRNSREPEILAPAGNRTAFDAAISAGADAIFLAGNSFGARAYAQNFGTDELLDAIDTAHTYGVRVYLTLNTLVNNSEFGDIYEMLAPLYAAGLESVIVQDFGVLKLVREAFPDLRVHASTQMNVTSRESAAMLRDYGVVRVVCARELTLPEIQDIKDSTGIEVECFVHGAMCVCYSGRCLMSSLRGGRSGNRGSCAQPCRQLYDGSYKLSMRDMCTLRYMPGIIAAGVDSLKIEGRMKNEYYVASAVEAYRIVRDDCLDGRLDMDKAVRYEKRLADIFNRGGFSGGYIGYGVGGESGKSDYLIYGSKPGRMGVHVGTVRSCSNGGVNFTAAEDIYKGDDISIDTGVEPVRITSGKDIRAGESAHLGAPSTSHIKPGSKMYRTRCVHLLDEIREGLIDSKRRIRVDMSFRLRVGEPMVLEVSEAGVIEAYAGEDGRAAGGTAEYDKTADRCGYHVHCEGAVSMPAEKRYVTDDDIRSKLIKLGDTPLEAENIYIDNDNSSFVRLSDINELRRRAVGEYIQHIRDSYRRDRTEDECSFGCSLEDTSGSHDNSDGYEKVIEDVHSNICDIKDFCFIDAGASAKTKDLRIRILTLPYISRYSSGCADTLYGYIDKISEYDGVYIRNIDDYAAVRHFLTEHNEARPRYMVFAYSLYAYNRYAAQFLRDGMYGLCDMIVYEEPYEPHIASDIMESVPVDCFVLKGHPYPPALMVTAALGSKQTKSGSTSGSAGTKTFETLYDEDLCYNVLL